MHNNRIATNTAIPLKGVTAVLKLLEEGATIPFIARYRKEMTGELDEVALGKIATEHKRLAEIEKRKAFIKANIEEQGGLTPALRHKIDACWDETTLEDIYLPFKRKRKTRAESARQLGLAPLANWLWRQEKGKPTQVARNYLAKGVPDVTAALAGARDIIAERVSEDAMCRNLVRKQFGRSAIINCKAARGKKQEADAKYRDYLDYHEPLRKVPSHRLLALLRGQSEGLLSVSIRPHEQDSLYALNNRLLKNNGPAAQEVKTAIEEGYNRLLAPSIETEFRNLAKAKADQEAIAIFATNLRQLLLAAPLGSKRILGIDPGFRTGCKVVALDEQGNLLANTTVYPHPPQNKTLAAAKELANFARQHQLEVVAIGNGTAGRETYNFCRGVDFGQKLELFTVNEAGASIYSASEVARAEFPNEDITVRGAVSIGRRLMDPLAELVKIDAKSIGVGQYQHDVNQTLLKEELDQTVMSCVNSVGINLNTAGKHLLTYISGLGPVLADNIVAYRNTNGAFRSREELKKVKRLGAKAYQQAAGFLRIRNAKHPLDNTGVHPERYALVKKMATDLGVQIQDFIRQPALLKNIRLAAYVSPTVGLPTLQDIISELAKPGLDPRGQARQLEFAKVNSINDLQVGMVLPGVVTNITAFGAFVDIGIKENGLIHVSQMADRFVKDPATIVSLNQQVRVKIIEIDVARKRVALSMKST